MRSEIVRAELDLFARWGANGPVFGDCDDPSEVRLKDLPIGLATAAHCLNCGISKLSGLPHSVMQNLKVNEIAVLQFVCDVSNLIGGSHGRAFVCYGKGILA